MSKLLKDFTDNDWSKFWENHQDKKEELEELGILADTILVTVDDNGKLNEFDVRLKIAKKLYQGLGGKRFWQLKMTEEDAKKLNKAIHGKEKNDHRS